MMIYEPREDSFLLARFVKIYSRGKSVLDVGTGSGIQIISARDAGAKEVLATDINEQAIELMRAKNIKAIRSDLKKRIQGRSLRR